MSKFMVLITETIETLYEVEARSRSEAGFELGTALAESNSERAKIVKGPLRVTRKMGQPFQAVGDPLENTGTAPAENVDPVENVVAALNEAELAERDAETVPAGGGPKRKIR